MKDPMSEGTTIFDLEHSNLGDFEVDNPFASAVDENEDSGTGDALYFN